MVKPGLTSYLFTKINTSLHQSLGKGRALFDVFFGRKCNFDLSLWSHEIWENERDGKEIKDAKLIFNNIENICKTRMFISSSFLKSCSIKVVESKNQSDSAKSKSTSELLCSELIQQKDKCMRFVIYPMKKLNFSILDLKNNFERWLFNWKTFSKYYFKWW